MTVTRTIRDWRGTKGRLANFSTAELISALSCATNARAQVQLFIDSIDSELAQRDEDLEPPAA